MKRLLLVVGFALLLPAAQAQETLRERLKARAEQRPRRAGRPA